MKTYTYNASGKRVLNNTVAGLVTSTWDEENIIVESSSTASLAGQYTDYPGWWGGLSQQQSGGSSQYYVFDPMGNTRLLLSSSNTVVKSYLYKAFGEELANTGSALSVFGYGGQVGYYRDVSTRLLVRARHLDTGKGRWISRDPIGFDGGDWNLYRYAENRPIVRSDPSGYDIQLDPGCKEHTNIQAAINLACKIGMSCNTLSCDTRNCLKYFCNKQIGAGASVGSMVTVKCGSPDCNKPNSYCAQTILYSITLCTNKIGDPKVCGSCTGISLTGTAEIAQVILHELLHTCGYADFGFLGDAQNPADRDSCICFGGTGTSLPPYFP